MLTKSDTFYHYGARRFIKDKVELLDRIDLKPRGGLWGSDKCQWKDYCEGSEYRVRRLKKHFKFRLKPTARVLVISSNEDWEKLRKQFPKAFVEKIDGYSNSPYLGYFFDWNVLKEYYDALIVNVTMVFRSDFLNAYGNFYWFDVDSICVWNPDVVEEVR